MNANQLRLRGLPAMFERYEAAATAAAAAAFALADKQAQFNALTKSRGELLASVEQDPALADDIKTRQKLANLVSDGELLGAALKGITGRAESTAHDAATRRATLVENLHYLMIDVHTRFLKLRCDELLFVVNSWGAKPSTEVRVFELYMDGIARSCAVCVQATNFQSSWTRQQPSEETLRDAYAFLLNHQEDQKELATATPNPMTTTATAA